MHVLILHPVARWYLQRLVDACSYHNIDVSIVTIRESTVAEDLVGIKEWIKVDALTDSPSDILPFLSHQYSGIVPGNEFAVIAADKLAEVLGLYHNDIEKIGASRNKVQMRNAFGAAGILQPKIISTLKSLNEFDALNTSNLRFPVIVKPVNMAMSLFVRLCHTRDEIQDVLQRMFSFSRSTLTNYEFSSGAIIEEFVEGREYSYEAVVFDYLIVCGFITKKYVTEFPRCYEVAYLSGEKPTDQQRAWLNDTAIAIARSWGMRHGVIHLEFKMNKEGGAVIEAGARPAGDRLPEIVQIKYGYSLEEAFIFARQGMMPKAAAAEKTDGYIGIRHEFPERQKAPLPSGVFPIRDCRYTIIPNERADLFSTNRRDGYQIVRSLDFSEIDRFLQSL